MTMHFATRAIHSAQPSDPEHAGDLIDDLRRGLHDVAAARAKSIVICA